VSVVRTREQATWLVEAATRRAPETVPLARLLSLAVFVEPELLRAMRVAFWPRSGPELEAALWFGPLVESHSPGGISLHREVVAALRDELRSRWQQNQERAELERAWKVIGERQGKLSPALALEERVAWHFVVGDDAAAERELATALKAHAAGGRPGVAAWASQAWGRLPEKVRRSQTGWLFQQMARSSGRLTIAASPPEPANVSASDVSAVLGFLRDVPLGIRVSDGVLEIGATVGPELMAIEVPDTDPRVLDVTWLEGDGRSQRVTVASGAVERIERGKGTLALKNLRGQVYELSEMYQPRFKSAAPATVVVAGTSINLSPEEIAYAQAIGDALARAGHSMVDGGFPGVDFLAAEAFENALRHAEPGVPIDKRLTHVVLTGTRADYKGGAQEQVPSLQASFTDRLNRADAVVLVGGERGTEAVYLLARDANIPVFACRPSRGVAAKANDDIVGRILSRPANANGPSDASTSPAQLARAQVRRYLSDAGPAEAAKAIANVLTPTPDSDRAGRAEAMRWIWGAIAYLRADSLDEANSVMHQFWDAMKHRDATALGVERGRLGSRYAPDRVLAYVSVQVEPRHGDEVALIAAAALERDHASDRRETRPLFQLLVSFKRLLEHGVLAADRIPAVVKCLNEILAFLGDRHDLDRGHQCRSLAADLVSRLQQEFPLAGSVADYHRVEALRSQVASELGLPELKDTYFFLLRVGNNFDRYVFNWEPFRDLAGPLEPSPSSIPVVVISDERQKRPRVEHLSEPMPHVRLHISPSMQTTEIARRWLDAIVDAGAQHRKYQGPFDWFVGSLKLDVSALSPKARAFLNLDAPKSPPDPMSQAS
jgi:hypothetical protein